MRKRVSPAVGLLLFVVLSAVMGMDLFRERPVASSAIYAVTLINQVVGWDFVGFNDMNDSGNMVGSGVPAGQSQNHALLYTNGMTFDLGVLPGTSYSEATGINNSGQVVGLSSIETPEFRSRGFLYSGGVMMEIGTTGGEPLAPRAINDAGQITGRARGLFPSPPCAVNQLKNIAFRLPAGSTFDPALHDLMPFDLWGNDPDLQCSANGDGGSVAINNVGQVIGQGFFGSFRSLTAGYRTAPNAPIDPSVTFGGPMVIQGPSIIPLLDPSTYGIAGFPWDPTMSPPLPLTPLAIRLGAPERIKDPILGRIRFSIPAG